MIELSHTNQVSYLKRQIAKLEQDRKLLNEGIQPIRDQIKILGEKIRPTTKKIQKLYDQQRNLELELSAEESYAVVENLKEGDKVWILHDIFRKGQYETILTDARVEGLLQRSKPIKYVPHHVTILKVAYPTQKQIGDRELNKITDKTFFAIDEKTRKRYFGYVQTLGYYAGNKEARIRWRRSQ